MPPFLQQVGSVVDRMENSAHIMVHFNSMRSYLFEDIPSGDDIKSRLSMEENIPAELFLLHVDGCLLGNEDIVNIHGSSVVVVRASIAGGLQGGKGGFGAMLRALAKQQGTKTTTDFGACRDLSGRRLRHVNDEKILQKWKEAKDKGEDFDVDEETPSGIEMWYLGAPSWAAGIKSNPQKKFLKPRRKTSICMDWVRSRKDRKAPEGAPAHWGCPRGRRCVFAHGDEELKGQAATLMEEEKLNGKNAESNRKRDAYVSSISQQGEEDSLSNMVLQGMRAQKKARPENGDGFGMKKTAEVAAPILSIEGMDFPGYDAADAVQVEPVMLPSVVISAPVVSAPVISTPVMLPVKKVKQSPAWVRNVSGELTLTNEGEVESESEFATAAVNCKIREGKWYYEIELLTAGLMQIGWADHLFRASSGEEVSEDGVGDDEHSWAYDGLRGKKWNKSDIDYGTTLKKSVDPDPVPPSSSSSSKKTTSESKKKGKQESATSAADIIEAAVDATHDPWKEGDVVGCLLEITTGDISVARVSYTLNGISLGIAYEDITAVSKTLKSDKSSSSGSSSGSKDDEAVTPYYYPCFSLEHGEAVLLNIGQRPFAFQPASDINVIHTSVSTIPTTPAITEIIEEKVTKKKPPAKKGKKSKKDIAEELEAEKEAEKEAERIATAAADAATAIATAEALKVSQSIPIIIAPYLPVLNALESSIRDLVPRETSDSESSNSGAAAVALAVSKDKSKGSNATDSSSKELVGGKLASELTPVVLVTEPVVPITYLPVNLESEEYSSDSLENLIVLGLQHLKVELERRGLKAGGSLEDRARRLFSVRGLKENEISAKLKSKASG